MFNNSSTIAPPPPSPDEFSSLASLIDRRTVHHSHMSTLHKRRRTPRIDVVHLVHKQHLTLPATLTPLSTEFSSMARKLGVQNEPAKYQHRPQINLAHFTIFYGTERRRIWPSKVGSNRRPGSMHHPLIIKPHCCPRLQSTHFSSSLSSLSFLGTLQVLAALRPSKSLDLNFPWS